MDDGPLEYVEIEIDIMRLVRPLGAPSTVESLEITAAFVTRDHIRRLQAEGWDNPEVLRYAVRRNPFLRMSRPRTTVVVEDTPPAVLLLPQHTTC